MSALRGGDSEIYCREPAAKYRRAFFMCGIEQRAKKGEDEIFSRDAERTRRAFLCGTIEGVWRFSYRAGECAAFLMRDDRDTADIYEAGRRASSLIVCVFGVV